MVSEAQAKATKKYIEKNPEKAKHDVGRRQAKGFIKNWATEEDLEELELWIQQKRNKEEIK